MLHRAEAHSLGRDGIEFEVWRTSITGDYWRLGAASRKVRRRTGANGAMLAMSDLAVLPLRRVLHRPPLPRLWQLRQNLTVYDAVYVALAELLGTTLLTADSRLAGAPGLGCEVELVAGRRCRREAGNAKHCAQ